jgi:hypothetical protein
MTCRQGDDVVQFGDGGKVGAEFDVAVVVPIGETAILSSADVAKGRPKSADIINMNIGKPTMTHRPFCCCLCGAVDN